MNQPQQHRLNRELTRPYVRGVFTGRLLRSVPEAAAKAPDVRLCTKADVQTFENVRFEGINDMTRTLRDVCS